MTVTQTALSVADTTLTGLTLILGVCALLLWVNALLMSDGTTITAYALMASVGMAVVLTLDVGVERLMG
jgi:hypothetical protein